MKYLLITILFSLIQTFALYAQYNFNKVFGNDTLLEVHQTAIQTLDGGFITAGKQDESSLVIRDDSIVIRKIAINGKTMWEKKYDISSWDGQWANDIKQLSDSSFVIVGTVINDSIDATQDVYLMKLNRIGEKLWIKTYGGKKNEVGRKFVLTNDGGFILIGYTASGITIGNNSDVYVVKTDSLGTIEWEKNYGSETINYGFSIQQTQEGGYLLGVINLRTGGNKNDASLIKLDKAGGVEWHEYYQEIGRNTGGRSLQTLDGGFAMTGRVSKDGYLLKTNTLGEVIWEKYINIGFERHTLIDIMQLPDSSFIVSGSVQMPFEANHNFEGLLMKLTPEGEIIWYQTYRHGLDRFDALDGYIYDVDTTSDGGFIMAGMAVNYPPEGTNITDNNAWLLKTDSLGNDWMPFSTSPTMYEVCVGDSLVLETEVSGGTSNYLEYQWSGVDTNFLTNSHLPQPTYIPNESGTYLFEVGITDSKDSSTTAQVLVEVWESPKVVLEVDSFRISIDSSFVLPMEIEGGLADYTHEWSGSGAAFLSNTTVLQPIFEALELGTFALQYSVTDANGCEGLKEIIVVVEDIDTGIAGAEETLGFRIFPNPAHSVLFIESRLNTKAVLKVYDWMGREMGDWRLANGYAELEVKDWARGMYLYCLVLENGERKVGKVLVE